MVFNGNKILPAIIGLSLCSLSAYLVYMLIKKDEDEKYLPKTSNWHRVFEMKVPRHLVPGLIGRGGSNIKEIADKTSCKINFKDDNLNEEERTCVIRGYSDDVLLAEVTIKECLANLSLVEVEEMWVPSTACGRIVGRGGENIQKITRASNAKVRLDSNILGPEDKRKVVIKGTSEQIAVAKSLIETSVAEDEEIRQSLAQRQPRGPPKISPSTNTSKKDSPPNQARPIREKFTQSGQIDGQIEVYVSAMEDPSKFWVQIVGPKATELDQLVEQMTEYYRREENATLHSLFEVAVGEIVAAQFDFDKKWYRAEVSKISSNPDHPNNEILDLYFVDYGDTGRVKKKEVYELRTDFLRLRFQAIECFLASVESANQDKEWSNEAIDLFDSLTQVAQWKKLWSKVVCYKERETGLHSNGRSRREGSPVPGIRLYDNTKEGGDVNIAEELVKAGYAVYEKDTVALSPRNTGVRAASESKDLNSKAPVEGNTKKTYSVDPKILNNFDSRDSKSNETTPEQTANVSDQEFATPMNGDQFINKYFSNFEQNGNLAGATNNFSSTPVSTRKENAQNFLASEINGGAGGDFHKKLQKKHLFLDKSK